MICMPIRVQIQCLLRILSEGHDGWREAASVASGGAAEGSCWDMPSMESEWQQKAMCVLLNVIRSLARDIPKVLHFLINLNRTQTLNISKYRRYCCNRLKHWPHSARILSTESLPPLACTGHWALQAEATWSSGAGVDPFAQMIQWYDVLHGSGSET